MIVIYSATPIFSTGISLASLCNAQGYQLKIVMPDDQSMEKQQLLERYNHNVLNHLCTWQAWDDDVTIFAIEAPVELTVTVKT